MILKTLKFPVLALYLFKIYLSIFGCSGLCCCVWAFFSCGEQGLLFVGVHGLLIVVACCRAQALGIWAWYLWPRGSVVGRMDFCCSVTWNLLGPGIQPVSPALTGEFLSTIPPGKSETQLIFFIDLVFCYFVEFFY